MGMLMDSVNPKLVWEDALSALRENYNTFFGMAIAIVIAAVLGGLAVLGFRLAGLSVLLLGCGMLVLLLGLCAYFYRRAMTRGIENVLHVGE